MRILIINPNSNRKMENDIEEAYKMCSFMKENTVDIVSGKLSPTSIESYHDEAIATTEMISNIYKYKSKYDGIIIACFGDPGLFAMREIMDVPVIGIAEASFNMVSYISRKTLIVTTPMRTVQQAKDLINRYGNSKQFEICGLLNSIDEICCDSDMFYNTLKTFVKMKLENSQATSVLLGCAGMSKYSNQLTSDVGIQVVNSMQVALFTIEAIVKSGLTQEKILDYAAPNIANELN